jgi:hypothetical protein
MEDYIYTNTKWDGIEHFDNEEFLKYIYNIFMNRRIKSTENYEHLKSILLASVTYVADDFIKEEHEFNLRLLKDEGLLK